MPLPCRHQGCDDLTVADEWLGTGQTTRRLSPIKTFLVFAAGIYLAIGVVLGIIAQPTQYWFCPDAGGINYRAKQSDSCQPTVTLQDRVTIGALVTVFWPPYVAGAGSEAR